MQQFTVHKGLVAPIDRENVDTDAIIPKQFLKSIRKTGFGPNLFDEWRYLDKGEPGIPFRIVSDYEPAGDQPAAIAELVAANVEAGKTDAEIEAYIKRTGLTAHHPASTCRMGTDASAPLDPKCRVRGVDVSERVVETINRGEIHIEEVDLDGLVHGVVSRGLLSASTQVSAADVFVIAVPTPFDKLHLVPSEVDLCGVEIELAKKIVKLVKESKLKVQAAIQGDAVRVTGAKRDDLQTAMALIRKDITDIPVDFNNFRD